ncbi:MAG: hypothetical protein M1814_000631 [Vezdaea aestivalis]|nr:MAG: hypothetical protein M1814_000631 [Vezdaea aestivalis]
MAKKQLEKWEGEDGFERYLAFMQEAHRHYHISVAQVLRKNFTSLFSMLRPGFIGKVFTLHPFESIYSRASRYFRTDRMRRVFTFGSMYMGMSPFNAPATYSLLQYTELAEGIWYPLGGFHKIVQALVAVGERYKVDYRLSSPVRRVLFTKDTKKASGIELDSGETILADVVVINADLVYAFNSLLPPSPEAKRLANRPSSCSSISFYWAMNRKVNTLTTHNVFLADKFKESFDDIFDRHMMPEDLSFYVNVPSRIDPTAAPSGTDSIVILVPVGHLIDENASEKQVKPTQNWEKLVFRARETIISTIEARTGEKNLQAAISKEIVNTPISWRDEFNLSKGSILGLSHSFFNVLSFRPPTRHSSFESLYFVGASTHPGTGVPICLAGSKITSEQILKDHKMEIPWTNGPEDLVRRTGLDKFGSLKPTSDLRYWVACLVLLIAAYILL